MLEIVIVDSVSVRDVAEPYKLFLVVSVYDSSTLTESAIANLGTASVSDAITVSEVVTVFTSYAFRSSDLEAYKMKLPTWNLTGSFNSALRVERPLRIPVHSLLASFGARLSQTIPVRQITASMTENSVGFSGSSRVPVWTASGRFAGRLSARMPVRSVAANFSDTGSFRLVGYLPTWSAEASFKYPDTFTLARQAPAWIGEGVLILTQLGSTLNTKIPGALKFSGSMYEDGRLGLTGNIPVRRLESTMYESNFNLDTDMPVWLMEAVSSGIIVESGRFTNYVLRYIRP